MNKLVLFKDDTGAEYIMLCVTQEYYDEATENAEVIETIDIEESLTSWPTNRPLSADF